MLAIDGHGTAIPANGETRPAGLSYGSISNLVQSLTAVVWNGSSYALRTFQRTDPAIAPLLTNLGRTFITEVTLEIGKAQRLQCVSNTTIPASTLFAAPGSAGSSSFASLVNQTGRVESIWFPFTSTPWVKTWKLAPSQPFLSTSVSSPYNYTFANSISQQESDFIEEIVAGSVSVTPAFEDLQIGIVDAGLITTWTGNLWGWSKYTQLYVQPTTERVTSGGWALLTSRSSIQQVVYDFYTQYQSMLSAYAAQGQYPMNGPLEIRVTGLDQPAKPAPAARWCRPSRRWPPGRISRSGTCASGSTCSPFRRPRCAISSTCRWSSGSTATTPAPSGSRPEWSKGWAYTAAGLWTNTTMLNSTIPAG